MALDCSNFPSDWPAILTCCSIHACALHVAGSELQGQCEPSSCQKNSAVAALDLQQSMCGMYSAVLQPRPVPASRVPTWAQTVLDLRIAAPEASLAQPAVLPVGQMPPAQATQHAALTPILGRV